MNEQIYRGEIDKLSTKFMQMSKYAQYLSEHKVEYLLKPDEEEILNLIKEINSISINNLDKISGIIDNSIHLQKELKKSFDRDARIDELLNNI